VGRTLQLKTMTGEISLRRYLGRELRAAILDHWLVAPSPACTLSARHTFG